MLRRGVLTVYGRQESWEDSPEGWPQQGDVMLLDGRPTAQWPRIRAGRDDALSTSPDGGHSDHWL